MLTGWFVIDLFGLHLSKLVHVAEGDILGLGAALGHLDSVEAAVPCLVLFLNVGEELLV